MSYFLLQFAECSENEHIDTSIVEYDETQHLNVIKGTNVPAVNYINLATETFTKTTGEGADSDRDVYQNLSLLMATETHTRMHQEATDSDQGFRNLQYLVDTRTLTESSEALDSDK